MRCDSVGPCGPLVRRAAPLSFLSPTLCIPVLLCVRFSPATLDEAHRQFGDDDVLLRKVAGVRGLSDSRDYPQFLQDLHFYSVKCVAAGRLLAVVSVVALYFVLLWVSAQRHAGCILSCCAVVCCAVLCCVTVLCSMWCWAPSSGGDGFLCVGSRARQGSGSCPLHGICTYFIVAMGPYFAELGRTKNNALALFLCIVFFWLLVCMSNIQVFAYAFLSVLFWAVRSDAWQQETAV